MRTTTKKYIESLKELDKLLFKEYFSLKWKIDLNFKYTTNKDDFYQSKEVKLYYWNWLYYFDITHLYSWTSFEIGYAKTPEDLIDKLKIVMIKDWF